MKLSPVVPILLLLAVGWAGLSCADIAAPSRSQVYEWRLITTSGPGTTDTLNFHWPRSRLPVRIWVEDRLDLPAHVQNGIQQWKSAFLYREFDALRVSDSNAADVIVTSQVSLKDGLFEARLAASAAPECEGGTDIVLPPGSRQIQLPIRVFVSPRFDPALPGVAECLALTTTHELGHAIGIFAHSPVATDIMYSDPTVSALSARDRATVERAYHLDPNLTASTR
jgi:hypothetical protein